MKKVILSIDGMTCSACSNGLEKYLNKQDGIKQAEVNLVMNTASIEYDDKKLKIEDLNHFVAKAGFKSLGISDFGKEKKKNNVERIKLIAIGIFAIIDCYISMSHMLGMPIYKYLNMMEYPINYSICLLVLTLIVIVLGLDIIKNGFKNLIHKTPNMDTLVTIGVFSSFVYSVYSTIMIFRGHYEFVDKLFYESSAMVIFFIKIGKYIENKNKDRTKEALKKLVTITPKDATIIRDNQEIKITIDEIKKEDIVICKPGEKIAVDGTIVEGSTHIDESFITGESLPVKKEVGLKVVAGSINYEGVIKYKAEKIGKESTVSEIVRMVSEAANTKAPIAKTADIISGYFVPVVIILATIVFGAWLAISKDFAYSINIFASILVVACPCSLGLATPLAIVISSGLCSQNGILVKSSEALENAHKVKTIVFDKTGTLTKGTLSISKIINYSEQSEEEIIRQIASIEKNSEHPIAMSILNSAIEKKLELKQVTDFKTIPGYGVYGRIENDEYYIGNKQLMIDNETEIKSDKDENEMAKNGNSLLFVSKNKELISIIGVKDTIRENIKNSIDKIKNQNIEVVMLTGDNEITANYIANEIGIEKVIANVKPQEKAEKINELKQNGLVMMCGDGINDSIGLVASDIGVSISNGTDIAIDSANVVLMNNNIDKINDLIKISKKTIRNIKQNLFWAFFYNLLMIPIAAGIFSRFGIILNPMISALAMTISSLTVVINALRLRTIKL